MKNILIIFFLFLCYNVVAQRRPTGVPTQFSTGWQKWGYSQSDSGTIIANRDTNWLPKFSGTVVFKPSNKKLYWFDSATLSWNQFADVIDTTSLSNRINLKQNQLSNAGVSGDSLYINNAIKRIQNDYGLTFSTNATKILMFVDTLGSNHVVTTSQLKDTAAAIRAAIGGGGSGLTSVGLSMPSAFSVSGSPLTSNGTINVSGAGTTAQYVRGNQTLATTDTGMIPNFYLKVRSLISNISPITYNSTTGEIGINNATTTGTKGAATFASSDFSDNGLGTISLADKVSAGTCVNCQVTYNAKGQATSFANGTPPQFVNASGAGDTLSINDTLKRLNPGFGILHTVTANNITQRVDTSVIATQYDLTQIPSLSINNIGAGLRWLATPSGNFKTAFGSNTIAIDSASNSNALTFKADTSVLATKYDLTQITSGINQLTGDVTTGPGSGSQAATISTNAVTNTKFRQSAGTSVVGRSANSTGNIADITATIASTYLKKNSTSILWDSVDYAEIKNTPSTNPGVYFSPAQSFDPSFVVFASAIVFPSNSFSHGTPIIWGILDNTTGHNSSFIDSAYGDVATQSLALRYPLVKSVLNHTITPDESFSGQSLSIGATVDLNLSKSRTYHSRSIGVRLTGDGAGNWTKSVSFGLSSAFDVTTYSTANGGTSFNVTDPSVWGTDYDGLNIQYIGPNNYHIKRVYSGLGIYNARFVLLDEFGNFVSTNPTTSDEIIISNAGMQNVQVLLATYSSGNNNFFGSNYNWWVFGAFECWEVAAPVSTSSIQVRWQTTYPSATNYKIYRATSLYGARTLIHTGTDGAFIDSGLSTNTLYWYFMIAVIGGVDTEITYFRTSTKAF